MKFKFDFPYEPHPAYQKKVAYFCMEFGIDQALKTYAGGLGLLAGSHMRSAYSLRQQMVGVGILWKYGYYDQIRKTDRKMEVLFLEREYGFLVKTDIRFTIRVSGHEVWVTAYYLPPELFKTAPVFFLSTDLPENDHLARTISHKLYDANPETTIAAAILLGEGGARLFETLGWHPDTFHLNESHALPLAFHLYSQHKSSEKLKQQLVFTNHTPEDAGNLKSSCWLLQKMGFFGALSWEEVAALTGMKDDWLDHTLSAVKMAGITNAVSQMHRTTLLKKWADDLEQEPNLISITNSQDFDFWNDPEMYEALQQNNDEALKQLKLTKKAELFEEVADQCGELFDPAVFTLVFAKRFAGYKRADLFFHNQERLHKLLRNREHPIQIIWAGKPYPMDYVAIGVFDRLVELSKTYPNAVVLAGFGIKLSKLLKRGSDGWLNVPRLTHEASGTSGMAAAMNGSVNIGLPDGWFPEFAKHGVNSFVVQPCDSNLPEAQQDDQDAEHLYDLLENTVLPLYYNQPAQWLQVVKQGMIDILPQFDSKRMAAEYYSNSYVK